MDICAVPEISVVVIFNKCSRNIHTVGGGEFAVGAVILHGDRAGKIHFFPDHVHQHIILHKERAVLVHPGDQRIIPCGIIKLDPGIVLLVNTNGKSAGIDSQKASAF